MFMSAGSSMIMFGAKFKHLVITLSREGSKSTIDKLLQPIVYILLRGGWTYTTSMFFAFSVALPMPANPSNTTFAPLDFEEIY